MKYVIIYEMFVLCQKKIQNLLMGKIIQLDFTTYLYKNMTEKQTNSKSNKLNINF